MARCAGRIIFLVTEDWYFWSHRLPMARAAMQAGFEVGVATRVGDWGDRIRAEGFELHKLNWTRGSLSVLDGVAAVLRVASIYRRERPDIVHHVALKPVVIGNVAAVIARVPRVVNALTGLGHLFTSDRPRARVLRGILQPLLRAMLARSRSVLLLQNGDDLKRLADLGFRSAQTVIIRGSGIDIDHYRPLSFDTHPIVRATFVGRIIEIKGVRVLMEAHRRLRRKGLRVLLQFVGQPDIQNPGAVAREEIEAWAREPDVEWLGHSSDIRAIWAQSDIAVLPSIGGEGLPKSLLEAAACGRPIIATDVPGSREIAIDGKNAILVPPGDPEALCEALARLAGDAGLRQRFATESRKIVESDLSEVRVAERVARMYQCMMRGKNPAESL